MTYCIIPLIWMYRIDRSIETENRLVVASDWGEGKWEKTANIGYVGEGKEMIRDRY